MNHGEIRKKISSHCCDSCDKIAASHFKTHFHIKTMVFPLYLVNRMHTIGLVPTTIRSLKLGGSPFA